MKKYSNLLSPIRIGNTVLKNRLIYPNATPHFLQGPETFPADTYRSFFSELAKNGAAIITQAERDPVDNRRKLPANSDTAHMNAFDASDPSVHNYLCQMVDEIHFHGSKIILCATPTMPGDYSISGGPGVGPQKGKMLKPLPKELIPQVIDDYIAKVRLYRNMGYDGITMRTDNILLPSENPRPDEYGGNVENRTRFLREVLARVKKEFGPGFITQVVMAGEQPHGYTGSSKLGYTIDDTIEFLRLAEDVVDIIELRESDMCKSHPTGFTFRKGQHETIAYSIAIKEAGIKVLTSPNGGFQIPEELEEYIASGKCDMISAARAFMCDFEYGKKLYEGRGGDITPCLWCNRCHGAHLPEPAPWINVCSVNPKLGIQDRLYRLESKDVAPKKVAVIGGGPSGMRAAIFAAEKGHSVTLFERTGYLGGQLYHAESFAFKWPIKDFRDWLVRQMDQLGVQVRMNTCPTPEEISAMGFDSVIAATGADPVLPASIQGLRDENGNALYPTCVDVFGKEAQLGHKVVIVGGSETGIETAMYLADNGHDVTVLTRQAEIAHDCSKLHYITMAFVKMGPDGTGRMAPAWEKYDNIHGIPGVTTKSVVNNVVTYVDAQGAEHTIAADSVVICGGMSPNVDSALSYAGAANNYAIVGDCNSKGNIQSCMRDAFAAVQRI